MLPACYSVNMGNIQVKHVSLEVHNAVRERAANEGMTVSDYVLDLLQRDLSVPSRREWLARLQTREKVDVPVVPQLDATRGERETETTSTEF